MNRQLLREIGIILRPLKTKIANSIARAVVNVVDDQKKLQLLQAGLLADEDIDDAERFQEYGFKSVPKPGAEAVIVFPNGDRAHGIVVAVTDRRYRPVRWEPGEVGMFTDEAGHVVYLRRGKITTMLGTKIEIGDRDLLPPTGIVNGEAIDPFTGLTHFVLGNASAVGFVKK